MYPEQRLALFPHQSSHTLRLETSRASLPHSPIYNFLCHRITFKTIVYIFPCAYIINSLMIPFLYIFPNVKNNKTDNMITANIFCTLEKAHYNCCYSCSARGLGHPLPFATVVKLRCGNETSTHTHAQDRSNGSCWREGCSLHPPHQTKDTTFAGDLVRKSGGSESIRY